MKKQLLSSLLSAALVAGASAAVLREGHADIGIAYEDNKLFPHIHDEENDVEYGPGTAVLLVKFAAHEAIPAGATWDFLRPGGQTHVWRLPNVENPELLFLGIGAEEIDPGTLVNDELTIALTSVTPPPGGVFSVYDVDGFGTPAVLMNSGDGISTADSFIHLAGAHRHVNWTFTEPGDYRVEFTVTAKVGTATKTAKAGYKFHVQSEASSTAPTVLISRDGIGLDIGGVIVTTLQNADLASGVTVVAFSGEGVTSADNTAIIQASEMGLSTVLVREGDEPANLPGLKASALDSPVVNGTGQLAFTGKLLRDNVLVTLTSDGFLAFKDGIGFDVIAREGDTASGQAADWKWNTFGTPLLADDGVLIFYATIINRTGPKPITRTGYWRRLVGGSIEPLAVTGTVLTTEIGLKSVKSIAALNPGASRDQDRAFGNDGALNLLMSFTDGTSSVIRFAAP